MEKSHHLNIIVRIGSQRLKSAMILLSLLLLMPVVAAAREPKNLATAKRAAIFYHDSGEYNYDQQAVIHAGLDVT